MSVAKTPTQQFLLGPDSNQPLQSPVISQPQTPNNLHGFANTTTSNNNINNNSNKNYSIKNNRIHNNIPYHDPKAQKEKMSSFKRHLAASRLRSDDAIRRKVEYLKEQRSKAAGQFKSEMQRNMEAASKARLEEELGRPVSSNEWPFVYFVVTLDQCPVSAEEITAEHGTKMAQTAKERQRFLSSRRRRIQEARSETERIREAGIDMGLRLEPIKPQAAPTTSTKEQNMHKARSRPSLTKHPTTPASSIGSRAEFSLLNSHDDLMDAELTRRNINWVINDTLSQAGVVPQSGRHCPINSLELPEISSSAKRRALGTSGLAFTNKPPGLGERRVTFAEGGLPVIKGNGIPVTASVTNGSNAYTVGGAYSNILNQSTSKSADFNNINITAVSSSSDNRLSRERTTVSTINTVSSNQHYGGEEETSLKPPWSTPLTQRSMSSLSARSKLYAPMALPKVDIVSEIYDELIVKTIHNFLMAEGYSNEKLQQLRHTVLARLSATYPHLVKHKAWRLTHSPCDKLTADDEELIMADPEKLKPRIKPVHGRLNKVLVDKGLTYDQMRPFSSPHSNYPEVNSISDVMGQSFMAVDGRTVTFTPREDNSTRARGAGLLGSSSANRKLPTTAEEREEEDDDNNDDNNGDDNQDDDDKMQISSRTANDGSIDKEKPNEAKDNEENKIDENIENKEEDTQDNSFNKYTDENNNNNDEANGGDTSGSVSLEDRPASAPVEMQADKDQEEQE